MTKWIIWIVVIIVIIAGVWYVWSMHNSAAPVPATTQATTTAATNDVGDNLALGVNSNTQLGRFLVAYNGMTVYAYSEDSNGTSTCYGQCAQTWTPYMVPAGTPINLEAAATGTAATIVRADGTTQITYNGMPLYFYSGDQSVGDTKGNGINGKWSVVKP